jgi:hypothetical protein
MSKLANEPAFPADHQTGTGPGHPGLTKREYFAAHAPEVSQLKRGAAEALIGEIFPEEDLEASIRWSSKVDARLRVIYADALIAELEKEKE